MPPNPPRDDPSDDLADDNGTSSTGKRHEDPTFDPLIRRVIEVRARLGKLFPHDHEYAQATASSMVWNWCR